VAAIVLAAAVLFLHVAASRSESPDIVLTRKDGAPFVDVAQTIRGCVEFPINDGLRQRIVDNAAREWAAFGFPRFALTPLPGYNVLPPGISPDEKRTRASNGLVARVTPVGSMEDDLDVRQRIGRYWASLPPGQADKVFNDQNQIWKSADGRAGWAQFWSAAFVSFVMCKSGLTATQFERNASHLEYIRPAVKQRDGQLQGYAYTAFDLSEVSPSHGDLLCAAREDQDHAINDLESFRANPSHGSYHCDIVVGFDQPGSKAAVVYGIGGNVINAVSLTETPISKGVLKKVLSPHGRNWFTVLKLNAPGAADFRKVPSSIIDAAAAAARQWQVP
jgi:hypothetical protein